MSELDTIGCTWTYSNGSTIEFEDAGCDGVMVSISEPDKDYEAMGDAPPKVYIVQKEFLELVRWLNERTCCKMPLRKVARANFHQDTRGNKGER